MSPHPYDVHSSHQHHPTLYPAPPTTQSSSTPSSAPNASTSASANSSSSFRNVSACNRCRIRKNRCDQNLPACTSCEKAGVKCVGFDPITKREIPRTYVYFLESRVTYLEELLSALQAAALASPAREPKQDSKKQKSIPRQLKEMLPNLSCALNRWDAAVKSPLCLLRFIYSLWDCHPRSILMPQALASIHSRVQVVRPPQEGGYPAKASACARNGSRRADGGS